MNKVSTAHLRSVLAAALEDSRDDAVAQEIGDCLFESGILQDGRACCLILCGFHELW